MSTKGCWRWSCRTSKATANTSLNGGCLAATLSNCDYWPDVGNAASGTGTIEPRTSGAQEGLPRCRAVGEAAGGTRADTEFCARSRSASVADGDAPKVSTNAKPGAVAEPSGR